MRQPDFLLDVGRTSSNRCDETVNGADADKIVSTVQAQNLINFVVGEEFLGHAAAI
jgi:hypothetical protein